MGWGCALTERICLETNNPGMHTALRARSFILDIDTAVLFFLIELFSSLLEGIALLLEALL